MYRFRATLLPKLILVAVAAAMTATAAAQQRQGSLELHKVRHLADDNGELWLSLQLVNRGTHVVKVVGVAPSRLGPWTNTGEKIDPGSAIRAKMKLGKDIPRTIWVDSSEGLVVFILPNRN
jgi:hypothetical protein